MIKNDIEALRALPIEAVAERLGLRVSKHKSLCPFHDDRHPSLTYNVAKNSFKCYACGQYGSTIDIAMKVLNVPFKEACEWLANEHNVIMTEYAPAIKEVKRYPPDVEYLSNLMAHPVLTDNARHFLFDQRHYNPKVVEWLGVSSTDVALPCWRAGKPFYDGPSLLFPYRGLNGRVLNVQSRYLSVTDSSHSPEHKTRESIVPRFRFPSNSKIHIFNLPILRYLKEGEKLYVSEGVTDCIALLSSGRKAIAIPSATSLKPEDFEMLTAIHKNLNLCVYPDNDLPGEKLYNNLLDVANRIGACLTRYSLPEGCKDFSDYYRHIKE